MLRRMIPVAPGAEPTRSSTLEAQPATLPLREYLRLVAEQYDRNSIDSVHRLLQPAESVLKRYIPPSYIVKVSLGQNLMPLAPWLAVLNPDVTDSPLHGLYLVYLFSEDRELVHLSLIQGITEVERKVGRGRNSRELLRVQSTKIREALGSLLMAGVVEIDLRSRGIRQLGYEAATIVAKKYEVANLPTEEVLAADLAEMLDQYSAAAEVVQALATQAPGSLELRVGDVPRRRLPDHYAFRPKDASQYLANVRGQTQIRDRRHELLVADYGAWLEKLGLAPSTAQHPIDVTFIYDGRQYIAELEVIRNANAAPAVREAIGQLLEYAYGYFVSQSKPEPALVAVFSEPIGEFYASLLERLGIRVAWKDAGQWYGQVD